MSPSQNSNSHHSKKSNHQNQQMRHQQKQQSKQSNKSQHKSDKTLKQTQKYDQMNIIKILSGNIKKGIAELKDIVQNIVDHQKIISKNNKKIGQLNLKDKKVVPINQLFQLNKSNKLSDKVFITKAFKYKYHPCSHFLQRNQNQIKVVQDLKQGLITGKSANKQWVWVIYYEQRFYQLQGQLDRDSGYTILDKNQFTEKFQMKNNKQIYVQLRYPQNITQQKSKFSFFSKSKSTNFLASKQNYRNLKQYITNYNKEYKKNVYEKYKSQQKDSQYPEYIHKFHYTYKTIVQDMLCEWDEDHTKNMDPRTKKDKQNIQSDYRICVVSNLDQDLDTQYPTPNYYFYHKLQQITDYREEKGKFKFNLNLQCFDRSFAQDTQFQLRKLKELLLFNIISVQNSSSIQKFAAFQVKMQQILKDQLVKDIEGKQERKKQIIQNLKKQNLFSTYENKSISNMIRGWKQANKNLRKNSKKTYLCMAMSNIYLTKQHKSIQVDCQIRVGKKKKKTQDIDQLQERTFQYEFDTTQTDGWDVRLNMKKNQAKTMIFQINSRHKYIPVQFVFTSKKNKEILASKVHVSRDQTYNNGSNFDLQIQQSGRRRQLVGFMEVFIVIKRHFKRSILEKYNIEMNRNIELLGKIGSLPPNYYQPTRIKYNPNNTNLYSLIASGRQAPVSKFNYEKSYIQLIYFLQGQYNYQRRAKIIDEASKMSNSSIVRLNQKMFQQRAHFSSQQRFLVYANHLKVSEKVKLFDVNDDMFIDFNVKKSIELSMKKNCNKIHPQTFRILKQLINQAKVNENKKQMGFVFNQYLPSIINRIVTMYKSFTKDDDTTSMVSSKSQKSNRTDQKNKNQDLFNLTNFCMKFLHQVYPYFRPGVLQKDLYFLRYIAQKYLPQLNLNLNREHIGLENFCSKYLLSFFASQLQEQITFRIWDFIIFCPSRVGARLNVMLTLLIFMQKTNLQPIIPLHKFINALYDNYEKFSFEGKMKKIVDQISDIVEKVYEKQQKRKFTLSNLKTKKGQLLLSHSFVKKILFDKDRKHKINSVGNNIVNLNDLKYKLPTPQYYGSQVQQIKIFLKSLYIFDTVSISNCQLIVRWHNMQSQKVILCQKSEILNQFIRFKYPIQLFRKDKRYQIPPLEFIITVSETKASKNKNITLIVGFLPILELHKDQMYSQQIRLYMLKDGQVKLSNKGQNILNIQFIMKSMDQRFRNGKIQSNNSLNGKQGLHLQKQYYLNQQIKLNTLYDRLLDYSLQSDTNQGIKQMQKTQISFQKMKNPLDQFKHQKYEKLQVPSVGAQTFPQVVMNSELMIEHFQTLIYQTFGQQNQFKTKVAELYQLFSKSNNFQMVFLTEIVIEAIALDRTIAMQQKLVYLYCIGKHYQNCGGKGIAGDTIDFIISYIYKIYNWANATPYSKRGKGQIVSGTIYKDAVKITQDGLDITNILKDWVHIVKIKYGNVGILLGNQNRLNILWALLPQTVLTQLKSDCKTCRIQIVYRKDRSEYIWAATVSTRDFSIISKGTKFLQKFPRQRQYHSGKVITHGESCKSFDQFMAPHKNNCQAEILRASRVNQTKKCQIQQIELDTSSQILFNCSNYISLESCRSFDFEQFRQIVYETPMMCYLLNYSSLLEPYPLKKGEFVKNKDRNGKQSKMQRQPQHISQNLVNKKQKSFFSRSSSSASSSSSSSSSSQSSLDSKRSQQQRERKHAQQKQRGPKYADWVLYRYQNCIQQWKRCQVIKAQNNITQIALHQDKHILKDQNFIFMSQKYLHITSNNGKQGQNRSQSWIRTNKKYPLIYRVPSFQVWSMDQNLVVESSQVNNEEEKYKMIEQIKQQIFRKNKDSKRKNITSQNNNNKSDLKRSNQPRESLIASRKSSSRM